MTNPEYKIFGLREVSRPKGDGDGYLYLALPGQSEGRPLVSFDLYKTSSEEWDKRGRDPFIPFFLKGLKKT